MKKMAIFCEGLTEQLFVTRLVIAIMGRKALVTQCRLRGRLGRRSIATIDANRPFEGASYLVQIIDSGGDETVASDVRENYQGLTARSGFSSIIALRDVYPNSRADIPAIRTAVRKYIPTKPVEVLFLLAVMEIEAWFIAEHTHFSRISPLLTDGLVRRVLGIDPASDSTESLAHPADDLCRVYLEVGESYQKTRASIDRTVGALDIDRYFLELGDRYSPVRELNHALTQFMS